MTKKTIVILLSVGVVGTLIYALMSKKQTAVADVKKGIPERRDPNTVTSACKAARFAGADSTNNIACKATRFAQGEPAFCKASRF